MRWDLIFWTTFSIKRWPVLRTNADIKTPVENPRFTSKTKLFHCIEFYGFIHAANSLLPHRCTIWACMNKNFKNCLPNEDTDMISSKWAASNYFCNNVQKNIKDTLDDQKHVLFSEKKQFFNNVLGNVWFYVIYISITF